MTTRLSLSATPGRPYAAWVAKTESEAVEMGFMARMKNALWIIFKEEEECH